MAAHGYYRILLHEKTFVRAQQYLKDLLTKEQSPGTYLAKALSQVKLDKIDIDTFLDLLVNTKRPQIYAESAVCGDGSDWNMTELSILGDISVAVGVEVYDNGHHTAPQVHSNPFNATLIYVPGALLENMQGHTPADYEAVTTDGQLDLEKYYELYERRLLPGLLYANWWAKDKNTKAFITIPGLGCGCFAGEFRGELGTLLADTIEAILNNNSHFFSHIKGVYFDPYNEAENKEVVIEGISYFVRPLLKSNKGKSQLCAVEEYENGNFSDCEFFSVVAWDHVSWPGNDFYIDSRATDDGVKAAATDSMYILTKTEGSYNINTKSYAPPAEFKNWYHVVNKKGKRLDAKYGHIVLPVKKKEVEFNHHSLPDELSRFLEDFLSDTGSSTNEAKPNPKENLCDYIDPTVNSTFGLLSKLRPHLDIFSPVPEDEREYPGPGKYLESYPRSDGGMDIVEIEVFEDGSSWVRDSSTIDKKKHK